ncbi:ADP-ribosylglycohydrolase family protein [Haloarchaeobius salinus]|uniref:ADP-ribosylglycohydrolase family protein n=1 Tax=Haloarchaeobius salinus TaxID=1198298 RepID=UPI00210D71D9|nr:ADP-ribosylglycohydrolase family protein [Haloarchaeobius salinus]
MSTNRAEGVLLGLACGDALGRPVEFRSAGQIASAHGTLTEMVGHGTWNQPAGTITDDTDQARCIARSLVECGRFDPADVADRFVAWYESGPFDIGGMTRRSIERLQGGEPWDEAGQTVWEDSHEGANAGNGSVMRCPPLAVAFADDPETLDRTSRDSSRITHADPRCTAGCVVLNRTIAGLLRDDEESLAAALDATEIPEELAAALHPVARGDTVDDLSTSGYVVHSLQTALHDGLRGESAEDAIVTAVNRGGDTDTVGAIAGAVAGARFGADALPSRWLAEIDEEPELRRLAGALDGWDGAD